MRAFIQIMFPEWTTFNAKRVVRYLWPPLSVGCELVYPRNDGEFFDEDKPVVRLQFRKVLLPQNQMKEQLQLGHVLVVYEDNVYRVDESYQDRRNRNWLTIEARKEKAFVANEFEFVTIEGERVTVGDDFLGLKMGSAT